MVVFDVTSRRSFDEVDGWLDTIRNNTTVDIIIFLVGNKSDLDKE